MGWGVLNRRGPLWTLIDESEHYDGRFGVGIMYETIIHNIVNHSISIKMKTKTQHKRARLRGNSSTGTKEHLGETL